MGIMRGNKGKRFGTGRALLAVGLLLLLLALCVSAAAELSTNLKIRTGMDAQSRKISSQTYTDASGQPVVADDKGYATIKYTYNTRGKMAKMVFLDASGQMVNCLEGYAQKVCSYYDGRLTKTEYFDVSGRPALGPEGYATQEITYTAHAKHLSTWEYDVDGKPVNLHRISEFGVKEIPRLETASSW